MMCVVDGLWYNTEEWGWLRACMWVCMHGVYELIEYLYLIRREIKKNKSVKKEKRVKHVKSTVLNLPAFFTIVEDSLPFVRWPQLHCMICHFVVATLRTFFFDLYIKENIKESVIPYTTVFPFYDSLTIASASFCWVCCTKWRFAFKADWNARSEDVVTTLMASKPI